MTNADRIRKMSDEELANYLMMNEVAIIATCGNIAKVVFKCDFHEMFKQCLDWLKSE